MTRHLARSTWLHLIGAAAGIAYQVDLYQPPASQLPVIANVLLLTAGLMLMATPCIYLLDGSSTDYKKALWPLGWAVAFGFTAFILSPNLPQRTFETVRGVALLGLVFCALCLVKVNFERQDSGPKTGSPANLPHHKPKDWDPPPHHQRPAQLLPGRAVKR